MQTHVAYGDACGGMNAGAALLVGLFHRKKTGKGQRIDISQVEGLHQLGVHGSIEQSLTGQAPKRWVHGTQFLCHTEYLRVLIPIPGW
ncbi:MAG: hypothetical protein CM1200mP4_1050 [Rhodospirillaceae bacterium]|nr:MAG: hypothetical protein CM1200mP4_1050 [Rhodospirillaceae bacterium]